MSSFFAYLSRMRYIERWSLMRNNIRENILEHSAEVAQISYFLGLFAREKYKKNINMEKLLSISLFHEIQEVITGDMPTPIKYSNNEIKNAFKAVEMSAKDIIVNTLNEPYRENINSILDDSSSYEYKLAKAADRISALVKCIEEKKTNNNDFKIAYETIHADVITLCSEFSEVREFYDMFIDAYHKTLDEL